MVQHVVAAHIDPFRDFLDVLGLNQPRCMFVKLLVKYVFIGLPYPGETPFDDRKMGKPSGDQQADIASPLGQEDVDHGRACVR